MEEKKYIYKTVFMKKAGDLMKNLFYAVLALSFSAFGNAYAQSAEDIAQVENYLNNIKSLTARFVQNTSAGAISEGDIYVAKPNKIRMEYAEPESILIVGNGDYIVYNDKELDQVTNIDYKDIPASLLLANDVKIDGKNLKVEDFHKDSGIMSMTLKYAKGNTGPITLVFSNKPFELKKWEIVDPQGTQITVSLYNQVVDENLDKNLFKFKRENKKKIESNRKK